MSIRTVLPFPPNPHNYSKVMMPSQAGKIVLVTGGNAGIGFETCLAFAEKGAIVYMASRSKHKSELSIKSIKQLLPEANIHFLHLDLQDLKQTQLAAKQFKDTVGKLDILINNAGIMAPPFELTNDGIESQFATNHVGHFLLTRTLMQIILESSQPRIINLSSYAHTQAPALGIDFENLNNKEMYSPFDRYAQSKLANILFTKSLFQKHGSEVIVASVHPGWVATSLIKEMAKSYKIVDLIGEAIQYMFALTPLQGCLTTLYAATADIKLENGGYFGAIAHLDAVTASACDDELAEKLWEYTNNLVDEKLLTY